MTFRIGGAAGAAFLSLILGTATTFAQGAPPPPAVQVATPLQKRVVQWDEYTGRFEATEQVEVRARVSGFIEAVHFTDGQPIKKGDLLFTIDRRPYELAADAARAEVARATAQVQLADNEVERAEALTQNRVITARDVDQRKANLSQARAQLSAAEANLRIAELNLDWTQVRAPIDGKLSDKRVDVGNLIAGGQAGATLLTTIVKFDPIRFTFDASEADYLRYSRIFSSAPRTQSLAGNPIPVRVRLADEKAWSREGRLSFVDNQLNARSGTIRGSALFDNKDQFLTPGTFGRMELWSGEADALLVPDASIVSDQAAKVVFTVGPENKVVPKPVVLGQIVDGLRVVRSGLTKDDRILISGLANPFVRPGAPVTPQPGEIKTAAASANGAPTSK